MKQIKTISYRVDEAMEFDFEVNKAIEEGWILKNRKVYPGSLNSFAFLYAEFEKEVFGENDKKNCTNCKHKGTLFVPDSPCPECKSYMKWECGL